MTANAASPPALIADLRALPRAFWVLFAGSFINRFGTFVWPFLTIYLTRQGYPLTAAAWAVSAFGFGAFCGGFAGGWLSDHIGRRNTIVLGTFGSATAFMLLYTASGLPWIIACTAVAGLSTGTYHPAISALLADIVPPAQRVRAYAAIRLATSAGFAFGACIGGILANYSLFWLFTGDALTTALYGCIASVWLPHGLRTSRKSSPWSEALGHLRTDRAFHILWIAAFCAALVFAQFGSTYSLLITSHGLTLDVLGWHLEPETVYGLLIGWNGVLIVFAELPLTTATLRFDARRVMALGYTLLGIGFALNAFAHSILTLWIAMTIFTFGEMISSPTASAYMARLAPERVRGRYMGVLALAWNGAAILGPQLGFRLFAVNPLLVWTGCGLLGLLAAVAILRARRIPAKETVLAPMSVAPVGGGAELQNS
jgi:MFS family permease